MSVDFFSNLYKLSLNDAEFGLCDDTDSNALVSSPAYVDTIDKNRWIAIVNNQNGEKIEFYPIDAVVDLLRDDGSSDYRCDAMLHIIKVDSNSILFIELKDRHNGGWLSKATQQLLTTLNHFTQHHFNLTNIIVCCYVSNKQRPCFSNSYKTEMLKFNTESKKILGRPVTLKVQCEITI